MSTTSNKITSPVLKEFDQLLEEMIGLQKKEQALILARRTTDLAETTQSIEWTGIRMQSMELDVRRELLDARHAREYPQNRMQEKLSQIKRLAQQNHTLLEHSLFFLQQLFQKVLEKDTPLHLYNLNGHAFQNDLGAVALGRLDLRDAGHFRHEYRSADSKHPHSFLKKCRLLALRLGQGHGDFRTTKCDWDSRKPGARAEIQQRGDSFRHGPGAGN